MAKCKNCGTEEQGYATLLDKRGYCYKPHCQSCSYGEVEQQNTRLQSELDKKIRDNSKLVKALKVYANTEPYLLREDSLGNKHYLDIRKIAQEVLKEIEEV